MSESEWSGEEDVSDTEDFDEDLEDEELEEEDEEREGFVFDGYDDVKALLRTLENAETNEAQGEPYDFLAQLKKKGGAAPSANQVASRSTQKYPFWTRPHFVSSPFWCHFPVDCCLEVEVLGLEPSEKLSRYRKFELLCLAKYVRG